MTHEFASRSIKPATHISMVNINTPCDSLWH